MNTKDRIEKLGDVADIINTYLKENSDTLAPSDSWNPAGFNVEHIDDDFGWHMAQLPKPSLEMLEELWKRTSWTAAEWNKMSIVDRIKSGYLDV